MKILPALSYASLALFFAFSLTACSPQAKHAGLKQTKPQMVANAGAFSAEEDEDSALAEPEPEEMVREEIAALSQPGAWEFGKSKDQSSGPVETGIDLSAYDFPITINKQVLYYLDLFQGKHRKYFSAWLARSTRYRPFIEKELQKAGLPQDLVFLAMIESGFNPSAYSCADASGLWQFIDGTGRTYGLKIDSYVDERREPEKATRAAIKYLSKLHNEFGDWHLAVAAYNSGEGRIENAINDQGTRDFWELAATEGIYLETKRYVPKLIAAILIGRNPEQYGFTDVAYMKPLRHETIDVPAGTDLEAVAVTANTSVKTLRTLNNELLKNQAPATQGDYTLRIPEGTKQLVASNLDKLRPVATTRFVTHTVKKGETLTAICELYNINKITLLKANNLRTASLQQGLRLQIPASSTKYVLLKEKELPEPRLAKNGGGKGQLVLHEIKADDTLSKLAKQYEVSVQTIMQWNKITDQRKVKKGQQIALYLDRPAPEAMTVLTGSAKEAVSAKVQSIRPVKDTETRKIVASAPVLKKEAKQGKVTLPVAVAVQTKKAPTSAPTWYVVKNGDSLQTIAKKFQTSPPDIKKWNKLSSNDLPVGSKLMVKKG